MRDFRAVLRPVGVVLVGFGASIGLCGLFGAAFEGAYLRPGLGGAGGLFFASALTLGLGLFGVAFGRRHARLKLTRREAILSVGLVWTMTGFCGSLPFVFGAEMSLVDAVFESVSGLTTTGATVIVDLEGLSRPILLWRSFLQWLGGMGIVVLFVAIFPNMGVSAKQMFKGEVPGAVSEGLRPRIAETAGALWRIYLLLTSLEVLLLCLLGVSLFDAVCHALTTMSTGGFSTHSESIGHFDASVQYAIALFMLIGTVNYNLYYLALRQRTLRHFARSLEFRVFASGVLIFTLALFVVVISAGDRSLETSFRHAFFMVATTVSSTGFATDDYAQYPAFGLACVILLMIVGGCSGSTAGGFKIERTIILAKQAGAQISKTYRPTVVRLIRLGKQVIDPEVVADVSAFGVLFVSSLVLGLFLVPAFEGNTVPLPAAFGALLSCLSNMGPAPFHELAGMEDNFAGYSKLSKLFFSFVMILGRLEFFTLTALFMPGFWRRQ
ncbi:MAG: potassium transporter TrkG [Myxococcota bacterium]